MDRRIDFIWHSLKEIKADLNKLGSDLIVETGDPVVIIPSLIKKYKLKFVSVFNTKIIITGKTFSFELSFQLPLMSVYDNVTQIVKLKAS